MNGMDVGLREKKKASRYPGIPVSQPANLGGDTTFCELEGGNAGWWTRGKGARKNTEAADTSYQVGREQKAHPSQ